MVALFKVGIIAGGGSGGIVDGISGADNRDFVTVTLCVIGSKR